MDRSRHSRCFRMSCPSRHRSRQTPQHKSRLPSRSMCTSMCSSVSSTLVTVWAFRENVRSEEHTSELQSPMDVVCGLLLEKTDIRPRTRQRTRLHSRHPPISYDGLCL